MKKSKVASLLVCIIFAVCCFTGCGQDTTYKVKDLNVSSAVLDGMKVYTYDEIKNQKVTIRQPVMEVLERGLSRTEPQVMSDTFTLPNTDVSVTFSDYPGQGHSVSMTNFEKYMLLRQATYNRDNAQTMAENGTLKKHPAVDMQYGAVPVANNAVKKRIITDPDYKNSYLTTGLYLPAGEIATVTISGLKNGESIQLTTQLQQSLAWVAGGYSNESQYFTAMDNLIIQESQSENPNYNSLDIKLHSQYSRQNTEIPVLGVTFTFTENKTYKIGSAFGGQLHIVSTNASTPVEMEITGCVETPHFILGVTSPEYFEEYLREAPGVMCTLDTENGQLVGPASYMRQTDDILKVAYMWHSNFAIDVSFNGRAYNYANILKFDRHVPAGSAVALNAYVSAMPDGWLGSCLNFENFKKYGNWGTLHELGHMHDNAYGVTWGMVSNQEGEVRNNVLTVLNYLLTCDMDPRITNIEHGESMHPFTALQSMLNISNKTDYANLGYFECVSLYANIMHQLTPEKFLELLYSYLDNTRYISNSRGDFAYRLSVVYGLDFRPFLNEMYYANVTTDMFTEEQLQNMDKLDEFWPIACYYANGVGSSETASKHKVDLKAKTTFDFANMIICPKDFSIVEITDAKYGSIEKVSDTEVLYTPPTGSYETDEFSVICQIEDGLKIELPIRLQLTTNGESALDLGDKPMFVASIKNFTSKNVIDKSKWNVIEAPIPETANADPNVLIDGSASTYYHTKYTGGTKTPMPHNFVIDMGQVNKIDFFQVDVRNNVNSFVNDYELYASIGGEEYDLISSGTLNYNGTTALINFNISEARYLKFVAVSATGGTFTVISEFTTGLSAEVQKVVAPNAEENFYNGFETSNQGGGLVSTTKDSVLVMSFEGEQFALFANTSQNSGKIAVYIDGELGDIIDLKDELSLSTLVYKSKLLEDRPHTIEIKTLDNSEVHLGYMTIGYEATLLNSANIYKEQALTIALVIFCVLFVILLTFIILYFKLPKFRLSVNKLFSIDNQVAVQKADNSKIDDSDKKSLSSTKKSNTTKKKSSTNDKK